MKGKADLTMEEVLKQLQDVERITKTKKRKGKKIPKRKQISSNGGLEVLEPEANDESDPEIIEILECIEVEL